MVKRVNYLNYRTVGIMLGLFVFLFGSPAKAGPAPAALTPKSADYISWEPHLWEVAAAGWVGGKAETIAKRISGFGGAGSVNIGYVWTAYKSAAGGPGDNGQLTQANFLNMAGAAGIAFIDTHGGDDGFIVVAYQNNAAGAVLANGWVPAPPLNVTVDVIVDVAQATIKVFLNNTWLLNNVKNSYDANEAVVILGACYSAHGAAPNRVIDNIGGRATFGYSGGVFGTEIDSDMKWLFDRLNGTLGVKVPGDLTEVGDAYNTNDPITNNWPYTDVWRPIATQCGVPAGAPGANPNDPTDNYPTSHLIPGHTPAAGPGGLVHTKFILRQTGPTKIKPAVKFRLLNNNPLNIVYVPDVSPYLSGSSAGGTGYVIFDTVMDTSVSASSILSANVLVGDVTINSIAWSNNHKISFFYCANTSEFCVEMTVSASARANGSPNIAFDGNQDPVTETLGDVGPNGDDFVWTFSN